MHDFIRTHIEEFVQLHPRPDALETPIEDPVKDTSNYYSMWNIKAIDNDSNP
tara:strand:- start:383 stop:538 length:156 start_codon:yes stop_codon:yes gene_type:complete